MDHDTVTFHFKKRLMTTKRKMKFKNENNENYKK